MVTIQKIWVPAGVNEHNQFKNGAISEEKIC